jgi:hypothetical protein
MVARVIKRLGTTDIVKRVKFRGLIFSGDSAHAYLCSNTVPIPEQLISIASQIKEKSGQSLFVIHSAYYIDKAILYQRNNDDQISK